ncbi:hypothetical protein EVAR_69855_1 [Eumeta japonica]|uniref:RNA-directed DNA polymerase from mobile element jockey n=1 Tax=Eumeta variegata TaxID=151549 RepID=A0A4C1ZVU6_EUMVA|nr:hypothetical protein EVAR_69855_1 [Eumeta japonica]
MTSFIIVCCEESVHKAGAIGHRATSEVGSFINSYTHHHKNLINKVRDPQAKLTRHYEEDIPNVNLYNIKMVFKQLKNNKTPGEDGIMTGLLRASKNPKIKFLHKLFNSIILKGIMSKVWRSIVVVLFLKKGDST